MADHPNQDNPTPFQGELKDAGFDTDTGKINELPGTDVLVRVLTEEDLLRDVRYRGLDLTPEQYAVLGRDALLELGGYGVRLPRFQMVWGRNSGGAKCLYTTVQKIDGVDLLEAIHSGASEELLDQLSLLYKQLASYYSNKLEQGGWYLDDLKNGNFIWGKSGDDETPRIYMLDLDPSVSNYENTVAQSNSSAEFFSRLGHLSHMINEAEDAGAPQPTDARNILLDIVQKGLLPASAEDVVRKIKQNLTET